MRLPEHTLTPHSCAVRCVALLPQGPAAAVCQKLVSPPLCSIPAVGNKVPADIRVAHIYTSSLKIDQVGGVYFAG